MNMRTRLLGGFKNVERTVDEILRARLPPGPFAAVEKGSPHSSSRPHQLRNHLRSQVRLAGTCVSRLLDETFRLVQRRAPGCG